MCILYVVYTAIHAPYKVGNVGMNARQILTDLSCKTVSHWEQTRVLLVCTSLEIEEMTRLKQ